MVFATCPRNTLGGYPTFLAVDRTHGENQKYGNTPNWDKLKLMDRCENVGRPLLTASTTNRPRISPRTDLDFQFPIFIETDVRID
jgi:hypothetical protein